MPSHPLAESTSSFPLYPHLVRYGSTLPLVISFQRRRSACIWPISIDLVFRHYVAIDIAGASTMSFVNICNFFHYASQRWHLDIAATASAISWTSENRDDKALNHILMFGAFIVLKICRSSQRPFVRNLLDLSDQRNLPHILQRTQAHVVTIILCDGTLVVLPTNGIPQRRYGIIQPPATIGTDVDIANITMRTRWGKCVGRGFIFRRRCSVGLRRLGRIRYIKLTLLHMVSSRLVPTLPKVIASGAVHSTVSHAASPMNPTCPYFRAVVIGHIDIICRFSSVFRRQIATLLVALICVWYLLFSFCLVTLQRCIPFRIVHIIHHNL
mmetsp:Transcript_24344/g.43900  ORF Transcript_24344/g.43900 Transcript_24344/m.43900 type:complete len:326 (+) Transcript_24344:633-1610(+)